jgi:hypothetical protein
MATERSRAWGPRMRRRNRDRELRALPRRVGPFETFVRGALGRERLYTCQGQLKPAIHPMVNATKLETIQPKMPNMVSLLCADQTNARSRGSVRKSAKQAMPDHRTFHRPIVCQVQTVPAIASGLPQPVAVRAAATWVARRGEPDTMPKRQRGRALSRCRLRHTAAVGKQGYPSSYPRRFTACPSSERLRSVAPSLSR